MKKATIFGNLGRGVLATALTAIAPNVTYADNFVGTDFQAVASNAKMSTAADYSGYEKLNLSVLGNTAWVPKRGAAGPIRTETPDQSAAAAQAEAQTRQLEMNLGPIGGRNTP